ncbi:hypothetical protein ElyMa_006597600 [Elysia marginata]|uniref:Uncharacterized protein n=1 Tax=Elysia marginata TaxID=1093978 RepID=A0AAV4IG56_9GAST|nr:hypothetical protein ElyMa_006597600 [Elysia marginata]
MEEDRSLTENVQGQVTFQVELHNSLNADVETESNNGSPAMTSHAEGDERLQSSHSGEIQVVIVEPRSGRDSPVYYKQVNSAQCGSKRRSRKSSVCTTSPGTSDASLESGPETNQQG